MFYQSFPGIGVQAVKRRYVRVYVCIVRWF